MAIKPFNTPGINQTTGTPSGNFMSALPISVDPATGAVDFSNILNPKSKSLPKPPFPVGDEEKQEGSGASNIGPDGEFVGGSVDRTPQNNYGYIDKPMAVSLLGALGGMPGMGAKMVSLAINANNIAAVDTARKAVGLEPLSKKERAQSLLSDNKGYLGDVVIGDKQYAVSLESMTPDGRTTLTPDEARKRGLTSGSLRQATPEEVEEARIQAQVNPDINRQGFLSRGLQKVQDGIDTITGRQKPEFTGAPQPREVAENDRTYSRGREGEFDETETFVAPVDPVGRAPLGVESIPGITAPSRTITPGAGLRNLADVTAPATPNSVFDPTGRGRPVSADADLNIAIDFAVKEALGPNYGVRATSGTYDPETQARIDATLESLQARGISPSSRMGRSELRAAGQVGTTRHGHGKALDFEVVDPEGRRVTDVESMKAVASALGRHGISSLGYGEGYMGAGVMHADTHRDRAPTWGGNRQVAQSFLEDRNTVGILPKIDPPSPTPRPENIEDTPVAQMDFNNENLGFQRTPEVLDAMTYTIAGELGPKTLRDLTSGIPERVSAARQEIAAIAGTIDNRAHSTRFAELEDPRDRYAAVLTPSQYNSLSKNARAVTDENYSKFSQDIRTALEDYDAGLNPSPVPDATHYRASYIDTPAWENTEAVQVGEHLFSTSMLAGTNRPEYAKMSTAPTPEITETEPTGFLSSAYSPADEAREARMSNLSPSAGFGTLGQTASLLDTPDPMDQYEDRKIQEEQAQTESRETQESVDTSSTDQSSGSGDSDKSWQSSGPSGPSGSSTSKDDDESSSSKR